MHLWNKQELLQALSTELLEHKLSDNLTIDEVVIDSRKTPKSGLFLALKGEKNDAHDFLDQAVKNGCKALLVQDSSKVRNADFLLVRSLAFRAATRALPPSTAFSAIFFASDGFSSR